MQIHVARNSAQLGIFAPEEIITGLQSGRFLASDLAWRDGMAAWTPLGDWPEFRASIPYIPPSAAVAPGEVAPAPSVTTFPWDISKSPASAYASFVALVRNPASVLASARLEFFPTLQLVWIILLAASVFSIIGGILHAEALAQVVRTAGDQMVTAANRIGGPLGEAFAKVAEYYTNTKAKGPGEVVLQVLLMVAASPLYHLLMGLLQWLGLRLLGLLGVKSCKTAELGRTVIAGMLGHALMVAFVCPATLLVPESVAFQSATFMLYVVGAVLYCRIMGGALRVNPWVVFGSAVLLYVVATCCCGCGIGAVVGLTLSR
jgi:hypothetical protein